MMMMMMRRRRRRKRRRRRRRRRRKMVTIKVTTTPPYTWPNLTSVTASDLRQGVKRMSQDERHKGNFPPNCTCIECTTSTHTSRTHTHHGSMCNVSYIPLYITRHTSHVT